MLFPHGVKRPPRQRLEDRSDHRHGTHCAGYEVSGQWLVVFAHEAASTAAREHVRHTCGLLAQNVGVDPQRDGGVGMAEPGRYNVNGNSGQEKRRRVEVAQVVQACGRKGRPGATSFAMSAEDKVLGVERPAVLGWRTIGRRRPASTVLRRGVRQPAPYGARASRPSSPCRCSRPEMRPPLVVAVVALAVDHVSGASEGDLRPFEVEIRPPQVQQFASPGAPV